MGSHKVMKKLSTRFDLRNMSGGGRRGGVGFVKFFVEFEVHQFQKKFFHRITSIQPQMILYKSG